MIVSAKQSGSRRVTYPLASNAKAGPLPHGWPFCWLTHWRDKRETSTNGNSVFQSAGPLRFIPSRGVEASAPEAVFSTAKNPATAIKNMQKRFFITHLLTPFRPTKIEMANHISDMTKSSGWLPNPDFHRHAQNPGCLATDVCVEFAARRLSDENHRTQTI
jgi:hypothetical protein